MSDSFNYWINGEIRSSQSPLTLVDVLVSEGYLDENLVGDDQAVGESQTRPTGRLQAQATGRFIVALDQCIVAAADWAASVVKPDSKIDVVGAITGG